MLGGDSKPQVLEPSGGETLPDGGARPDRRRVREGGRRGAPPARLRRRAIADHTPPARATTPQHAVGPRARRGEPAPPHAAADPRGRQRVGAVRERRERDEAAAEHHDLSATGPWPRSTKPGRKARKKSAVLGFSRSTSTPWRKSLACEVRGAGAPGEHRAAPAQRLGAEVEEVRAARPAQHGERGRRGGDERGEAGRPRRRRARARRSPRRAWRRGRRSGRAPPCGRRRTARTGRGWRAARAWRARRPGACRRRACTADSWGTVRIPLGRRETCVRGPPATSASGRLESADLGVDDDDECGAGAGGADESFLSLLFASCLSAPDLAEASISRLRLDVP